MLIYVEEKLTRIVVFLVSFNFAGIVLSDFTILATFFRVYGPHLLTHAIVSKQRNRGERQKTLDGKQRRRGVTIKNIL